MLLVLLVTLLFSVSGRYVYAAERDTVLEVYSCGDDVGIRMQQAGWVVARKSDIGVARVNRMQSIALTLLVTSKETGYFDNAHGNITWCGIPNVNAITVLGVRND